MLTVGSQFSQQGRRLYGPLFDAGGKTGNIVPMAFLVCGGVVSIWGAMAIAPVLKLKPFLLYLALAVLGSLAAGYVFEWAV